jgi:hypothetical protein
MALQQFCVFETQQLLELIIKIGVNLFCVWPKLQTTTKHVNFCVLGF